MPDYPEAPLTWGLPSGARVDLTRPWPAIWRALQLKPDHASALHNLWVAFKDQGRLAEAAASLQQALTLQPDLANAQVCLGNVFKAQGRLDDAIAAYHAALELRPDFAEAHCNLGNVFKDQGLLDDAIAAYRNGVRLKVDAADMHSNLIYACVYHPGYDAATIHQECSAGINNTQNH